MKILRVISTVNPAAGGPINGLINSTKGLEEMGHEITVLSLDDPDSSWVQSFDLNLVCFKPLLKGYSLSFRFKEWLNREVSNYDAVIIHGLWQYHSFTASKICTNKKVPYLLFTHGMLDPWFNKNQLLKTIKKTLYWKLFESQVINGAHSVLFTSNIEKEQARLSFKPYNANEQVVAYGCSSHHDNGANKNVFYREFPELLDKKFGLFLSRIHPKKGIDISLRLCQR